MKNIVELKSYISYQLEQLSIENKHHEFEHLARHIARQRISPNILPATGPVAGKGDQGRDFETFKTFIEENEFSTNLFGLGLPNSEDKVVFACTIAKDGLIAKINSDIKKIVNGSGVVTHIYFLCVANINVADRHKMEESCHENYNIHLEVLDGLAISELLTEKDLFWIAEHYLAVNADMYPHIYDSEDTAYQSYRKKWVDEDQTPCNLYDFYQIINCLRESTFNETLRPDLSRWIDKIKVFESSPNTKIVQRANYEICVATLRGTNSLDIETNRVKDFFSLISPNDSIDDLERASNLITYCSTALLGNDFNFSKQELHNTTKTFIGTIDAELKKQHHPEMECGLLLIKGMTGIMPFRSSADGDKSDYDVFYIFPYLNKLLDIVNEAPLFSLEKVAKIIEIICPLINDENLGEYEKLTDKLDRALQERSQGYLVAEKCTERAIKLYSDGQYTRAIRELHKSKVNWFSEETIKYSVISMLMLSESYNKIGMTYPAIYYSMAVTHLISNRDIEKIKKYLPEALINLCRLHYSLGEWFVFIDYASAASVTFDNYADNDSENNSIEELDQMVISALGLSDLLDKGIGDLLHSRFQEQPFDENVKKLVSENIEEYKGDLRINAHNLDEQLDHFIAYPFSDIYENSTAIWEALGITWVVSYENNGDLKTIAKEFLYLFQMFQAELYNQDLLLLPTKVEIAISESKNDKFEIIEEPSNEKMVWNIELPISAFQDSSRYQEVREHVTGYVIYIIVNCSLLKYEDAMKIFDTIGEEGIFDKILFAGTYYDLSKQLYQKENFDPKNINKPDSYRIIEPKENANLPWFDSYCLDDNIFDHQSILENRYRRSIIPIQLSLPKLLKDENFKNRVSTLREEGYLDWQIIGIISSLIFSYRYDDELQKFLKEGSQQKVQQLIEDYGNNPETVNETEVPPQFFTAENISNQTHANMVSTIKNYGFDIKQQTPDFEAIKKFLGIRCDYFVHDIQHEDYLGWNDEKASE